MKKQLFPPEPTAHTQAHTRERNCGRCEIRAVKTLSVTPAQLDFPAARLAARLETRTKRKGKWTREVVYLITSLNSQQLEAKNILALKRGYWVIESRLHHCLDITMREDQSRVRTPNSARVLGTIRRVVLSLANAAVDKARERNPKTKFNTKSFQQRFRCKSGGEQRLRAILFAKKPNVTAL